MSCFIGHDSVTVPGAWFPIKVYLLLIINHAINAVGRKEEREKNGRKAVGREGEEGKEGTKCF